MDNIKKRNSFYCGAFVWIVTSIICFTSKDPGFKPVSNIFWGIVSLGASVLFFINGYKINKQLK